jgi:hypothetical protein
MGRILFTLTGLIMLMTVTQCSLFKSDTITIKVGKTDYVAGDVPVFTEIELPEKFRSLETENIGIRLRSGSADEPLPGQLIKGKKGEFQLCWILPQTNRDKPTKWKAEFYKKDKGVEPEFEWKDIPDKNLDLYLNGKKVFRYCYELDDHFKKGENLTAKNRVFYHIFDLKGEDVITNGPEEGLWSHHRGIMIGWRDIGFRNQELSFWGMEDLTVQKHIRFTETSGGPVAGKVVSEIHWNDSTGLTLLKETRTAVIYRQPPPDIIMLDFTSKLTAVNGDVKLNGDAEHGGVQFRAHNDVAEGVEGSKKPVYIFHKDGIDPYKDYNLPWVGMTYGLRKKTYSVLDIDHPENPKPSIWSAYRDYARFGPFFVHELHEKETLEINYRFWISESNMPDREILHAKSEAYVNPPQIEVLTK